MPRPLAALAHTDLTELELPDTMKANFPDPADVLNFTLTITPDEGTFFTSPTSAPIQLARGGFDARCRNL